MISSLTVNYSLMDGWMDGWMDGKREKIEKIKQLSSQIEGGFV